MYFRILGPLEVTAAETAVALGGPKPRALLAALLLRRGTVVSTDALAAAVWGEDVPPGAASALRAYVSRLRTALDSGRLDFRAGGYVLTVADDEYDAAEAQSLIDAARTTDPAEALRSYDAALALWRGEALAEFAGRDFADAEAARLAELALTAGQERVDVLLALGRGAELVADLELTTRRFPDRERSAVQLMHALYAAGRQSEALAAFHRLRHHLDIELGVAPSEPARLLYQRILEQDPALLPPRPAPGNLPRRATSFVGREVELAALADALKGSPLVTITGPGGVGKSRLALEAAGRDRDRAPDGVWLCELAPMGDSTPIGHAVAAALGVRQHHGLSIDETVVEYLRGRRLVLILDNCEHVLDAVADLAASILAHCPEVGLLATSRERLGVDGEQVWPVPPLSTADAGELFVLRTRAQRPDFDGAGTDHAVDEICRRLDGLPLAIELAAARAGAMSPAEIARHLDEGQFLVGTRRGTEPRHRSLEAAIGWSYELLDPGEQALFARLAVFAGGFDLEGAHGVCGEPGAPDAATLATLSALVDRSMVVPDGAAVHTRYRILETLRSYGRERLRAAGEEAGVARRHAEYFAELAAQAAQGARGPAERAWIERTLPDRDNLRAAFQHAIGAGDIDLALRVVTPLAEVLHVRASYEASEWAEHTLDLADPEHPLFVAAVGAAARGAWNRGDLDHARRLAARAGGRSPAPGTARVGWAGDVLADVALYEGNPQPARAHYEQECRRARAIGEPARLVWTLYYLAVCHAVLREPERGLAAAEESLAVAERSGNPTARSMGQYALGLVQKKSHPDLALARFDEAARLAREVHNFWWEGIALMEAASTRGVHGDPVVAAREFLTVLGHWERVGDWTQQWLNLRYVVRLLYRAGPTDSAVRLHHCLLANGKPSPLKDRDTTTALDGPDNPACRAAAEEGGAMSGAHAVALARTVLRELASTPTGD